MSVEKKNTKNEEQTDRQTDNTGEYRRKTAAVTWYIHGTEIRPAAPRACFELRKVIITACISAVLSYSVDT